MVGALVVFAVRELPGEEGRQEAGPTASLCKTHPTASLIIISQAQRRRSSLKRSNPERSQPSIQCCDCCGVLLMNWLILCFLLDRSISETIPESWQEDAIAGAVVRAQQQQQQHNGVFGRLFWGVGRGE